MESLPVAATTVILRERRGGPEVLMIERPDRGSFAGAWVFPGGRLDDVDAGDTEIDRARSAAVRETREETSLALDLGDLLLHAQWTPPPGIPLRIRTWFFLTRDPGGEVLIDPSEAVDAAWLRPADALARHGRGGLTLYPPTWMTLHLLQDHGDVDSLLAATRASGTRTFAPEVWGRQLLWSADDAPARHRLDMTGLPWSYATDI